MNYIFGERMKGNWWIIYWEKWWRVIDELYFGRTDEGQLINYIFGEGMKGN